MAALTLPDDVTEVLHRFRTCEFTTMTAAGQPVTWPVTTWFDEREGTFLASTSLGFPAKARNAARDPRVALLFSNATGSGLTAPPMVLVQGHARVDDRIVTDAGPWEPLLEKVLRFQPKGRDYHRSALTRKLMDWYYLRLLMTIEPATITWWAAGDRARTPEVLDVR